MVFLIAFRNLLRNRRNTLIVVLLIALISMVFFIGTSVISQSNRGLQATYIDNITGDLAVMKKGEVSMSLFGANTPVIDEFFTIPALPNHEIILEIVDSHPWVSRTTSQISGVAALDVLGRRDPVFLCGVDASTYFSLLPGIVLQSGSYLQPGERGAMCTARLAERIEQRTGEKLEIGESFKFTTSGGRGFKIREVPLVGIYSHRQSGQFLSRIILTDPQTVRSLNSVMLAAETDNDPTSEAVDTLSQDIDSLFGEAEDTSASENEAGDGGEEGFSIEELTAELSKDVEESSWTGGAWNFILIRLQDSVNRARVMNELNADLASLGAKVVNWRTAAGKAALLVLLVRVLFYMGFGLVSVAGVIGIVNILLISIFRRTREFGTLRAIGASDGYLRGMILIENLLIAFVAGICGVLGGLLLFKGVNAAEIVVRNQLIASLFGQSVINISFSLRSACGAVAAAVALGFTASLYPVQVALRIQPIVAVRRG